MKMPQATEKPVRSVRSLFARIVSRISCHLSRSNIGWFALSDAEAAGIDPTALSRVSPALAEKISGTESSLKVGFDLLKTLGLRHRGVNVVSCPSCGRAQVDVYTLANAVSAGLEGLDVPLRVAVMGCVVNGPGEAREADLGVASGNGKGQIFVKGEVIKTVPESQIVETLIEEAMRLAEQQGGTDTSAPGSPVVTVS